ncbi:hypothetical protein [Enterocloster citroniae]|uniref:hypothetical protein n=1 Tax=Enterocloster citroniae TaxID=358743 RepID=UPI0034A55B3B
MVKTEKNVTTVSAKLHGEKTEIVIQGDYADIVVLTIRLLVRVSKALAGDDMEDPVLILQALCLTAKDELRQKMK